MLEIYKISVNGNCMILFSEDDIKHCVFVARLTEYFSGNLIHVDKVRNWNNIDLDIDLHIFLHDLNNDVDYADYALIQEKMKVFAQPFFESFLDTFLPYEDTDSCFVDYVDREYTEYFLCKVEENKKSLMQEAD